MSHLVSTFRSPAQPQSQANLGPRSYSASLDRRRSSAPMSAIASSLLTCDKGLKSAPTKYIRRDRRYLFRTTNALSSRQPTVFFGTDTPLRVVASAKPSAWPLPSGAALNAANSSPAARFGQGLRRPSPHNRGRLPRVRSRGLGRRSSGYGELGRNRTAVPDVEVL